MPLAITKKAYEFWAARPQEHAIIVLMASKETWHEPDSEALDAKLQELDATFDHAGEVDFDNSPDFIKILASLSVITQMYLVRRYEMAFPGAGADILKLASSLQNNEDYKAYADVIVRRFAVFERMKLLKKVFSVDRLQQLKNFIDSHPDTLKS